MFSLAYHLPKTTSNSLKFCRKKCVQTKWIFRTPVLSQKVSRKTTWIFRPSKLHRKKHVETTWIFLLSKLYVEMTWKLVEISLQRIDVISTSNRRELDVKCLVGYLCSALLGTELEPSRLNSVVPTSCLQIYCKYGYPKMMYT